MLPLVAFSILLACSEEESPAATPDCLGAGTVSGQVLDPDGSRISATVELRAHPGDPYETGVPEPDLTVEADAEGRFVVELEPGSWSVYAPWDGPAGPRESCYLSDEMWVEWCGTHDVVLEFECVFSD